MHTLFNEAEKPFKITHFVSIFNEHFRSNCSGHTFLPCSHNTRRWLMSPNDLKPNTYIHVYMKLELYTGHFVEKKKRNNWTIAFRLKGRAWILQRILRAPKPAPLTPLSRKCIGLLQVKKRSQDYSWLGFSENKLKQQKVMHCTTASKM